MGASSAAFLASISADKRARIALLGWLYSKGEIRSEADKKLLKKYEDDLQRWEWRNQHFPKGFRKFVGKRPRRPKLSPPNTWSFDTNFREYIRREIAGRPGGKVLLKAYDLSTARGREAEWRKIKRQIKDRALRAVLGSKANVVKKIVSIVKGTKEFDTVDFVKRKIRAAISLERRQDFEITDRLRLGLTVRTNLQKVHVGGKLYLLKPLPIKTVLRFVAKKDERTCPICGPCHNTTLPKTHPWWKTHIPPLHHECRCTIVALGTKEAAKWAKQHEGVDKSEINGPPVRATKWFGKDPSDPKNDWKPNPKDYPPEMRDIVERKLKQMEKRR